jgi:hypothetical protein
LLPYRFELSSLSGALLSLLEALVLAFLYSGRNLSELGEIVTLELCANLELSELLKLSFSPS